MLLRHSSAPESKTSTISPSPSTQPTLHRVRSLRVRSDTQVSRSFGGKFNDLRYYDSKASPEDAEVPKVVVDVPNTVHTNSQLKQLTKDGSDTTR